MKCVECGNIFTEENKGTNENPLYSGCYDKMSVQYTAAGSFSNKPVKQNRYLKNVGFAVIAIMIILGLKFYNKSQTNNAVKKEIRQIVKSIPGYTDNSDWYDGLLEDCYASSFDESYDLGSKRRAGRLREKEFLGKVFDCMHWKALYQGKDNEADMLKGIGKLAQTAFESEE